MNITLKGAIEEIFETQQVTDKFRKREFVLLDNENQQYPESIKMEMIQDNCDHLDGYVIGQVVEVDINIKGRKWNDPKGGTKYFVTLQAWRIRGVDSVPQPQNQDNVDAETDDLPF